MHSARIAILADVHANLPALTAVLADAREHGCERFYHAGDLIGIGPYPGEVVDLARNDTLEQWARLPAEQQAWLAALLPATAAPFTADTAGRAWGVAPAVAGRRLWVLAQGGWGVTEADGAEDGPVGWRMATCARLALAEVVQQAEMSAN